MELKTVDYHTLKELIDAGVSIEFIVHGSKDGFYVEAQYAGKSMWVRKVKLADLRKFRTSSSATIWLKEKLDVTRVILDTSNWDGFGLNWRPSSTNERQDCFDLTAA